MYFDRTYGEKLHLFQSEQEYGKEGKYFPDWAYGECFKEKEVEVQCELMKIDTEIDPSVLPYDRKMAYYIKDFCYSTSAHGIPMIGSAQNKVIRFGWTVLYTSSVLMFLYQGNNVLHKYGLREKIVDIQCELLNLNMEVDPAMLPYDQKLAYYIREFAYTTSGHGIPMIAQAKNRIERAWWTILYVCSFAMFAYQVGNVIEKYNLREKIVDIQLVFDAAPFPAITLCNLNPYKKSAASNYQLVARTLKAFDDVMNAAGSSGVPKPGGSMHHRLRRSTHGITFEVAKSKCECEGEGKEMNCEADKEHRPEFSDVESVCYCAFDRLAGDAWPCFPVYHWTDPVTCHSCNEQGFCNQEASSTLGTLEAECLCQDINDFCLAFPGGQILNLWEYYGDTGPTEDPSFLEALGFEGMTDEVAIVTKAKENIVFAMATLSMEERKNLSNTKEEFVHKCSFNGVQCSIKTDFMTHVDPIFGNCFTFNHNRTTNVTSIRAGPMYGLRLIVYVNATEYLPTTEAAGVKMTIHEKYEYPFPDTFGYNAPVGYISSFGIKLKRMERLSAPFGDCVKDGRTGSYIYTEYEYTTEGCFRSCFQQIVLHECGCGDPRFPVLKGYKHCQAADPAARKCLDALTKQLGGLHGSFKCRCQQPCKQSSYSVTYSASVWPSKSLQVQLGVCEGDHVTCNQHYKENGAMIEVFYEQLNYEQLTESEAYGVVNLLSDFGGQFGLWLGVSVITVCEFVFIVIHLVWITGHHHYAEYLKRQARQNLGLSSKD